MSEIHYEEMEAGRELDILIAKQVFGRTARGYRDTLGEGVWLVDENARRTGPHSSSANLIGGSWQKGYDEGGELVEFYGSPCPAYSSNIASAWEVVEELYRRGFILELCIHRGQPGGMYAVSARVTGAAGHAFGGKGSSAPLAICRAALWAVETAK